MEHQKAPETRRQPLESRIRRNFYLSFKFSQGESDLQKRLISAIVPMYPFEELKTLFPTFDELKNWNPDWLNEIKAPVSHKDLTSRFNTIEDIFSTERKRQWGIYSGILLSHYKRGMSGLLYEWHPIITQRVLLDILTRELKYVSANPLHPGRPKRTNEEQRFESFVRTYVFKSKPTGSPEFDVLFRELKEFYFAVIDPNNPLSDKVDGKLIIDEMNILVDQWEKRFPGQKFFDQGETTGTDIFSGAIV